MEEYIKKLADKFSKNEAEWTVLENQEKSFRPRR